MHGEPPKMPKMPQVLSQLKIKQAFALNQNSAQKGISLNNANTSSGSKIKLSFPRLGQKEISTDEKRPSGTSFDQESISPPVLKLKKVDNIKIQDFDDGVHQTQVPSFINLAQSDSDKK